jgi:hypothetical protein
VSTEPGAGHIYRFQLAKRDRQAVLVTSQELEEFLQNSPKLYHMAEFDSWSSIRDRGLLSTTAILDLYGVQGAERRQIEEVRRPASVTLTHKTLPPIVIRDQLPMTDAALQQCLQDGLAPRDWYLLLNSRVFFWPSRERLTRLLGAKAYRNKKHDILEVDSRSIVQDYRDKITLSPINSGSTLFDPQPRGKQTFSRIVDYPYSSRPKDNRLAELAIDHSVPDVSGYVTNVLEMQGNEELGSKEP